MIQNAIAHIYKLYKLSHRDTNNLIKEEKIVIDDFNFDSSIYFENSMKDTDCTAGIYALGIVPEINMDFDMSFDLFRKCVVKTKPSFPELSIFMARVSDNGTITYTKLYEGEYNSATISQYKNL